MFDGEETTHIVVLMTDGTEYFAIPAKRTGDKTFETNPAKYQRCSAETFVSVVLGIPGAKVE